MTKKFETTLEEFLAIKRIEALYNSTLILSKSINSYNFGTELFYNEENDNYIDFVNGIKYLLDLITADDRKLFKTMECNYQKVFLGLCEKIGIFKNTKNYQQRVDEILNLMYQLEDDTQYENINLSKAIDFMQKINFEKE